MAHPIENTKASALLCTSAAVKRRSHLDKNIKACGGQPPLDEQAAPVVKVKEFLQNSSWVKKKGTTRRQSLYGNREELTAASRHGHNISSQVHHGKKKLSIRRNVHPC